MSPGRNGGVPWMPIRTARAASPLSSSLVDWAKTYVLRPGLALASAEDMQIPHGVASGAEAIGIKREHQARTSAAVPYTLVTG